MPVKRRRAKRRMDAAAELKAWRMAFTCSYDFLGDLKRFGVKRDPSDSEPARLAAREAWARLGARFMTTWEPRKGQPLPWAAEEFGLPKGDGDAD